MTPKIDSGISKCMQSLNRRYVHYINQKYNRMGTLWGGRYSSRPIEQGLIIKCYRDIELLPGSMRVTPDPYNYEWSSIITHTHNNPSYLIQDHPEFLELGGNYSEIADKYLSFLREGQENNAFACKNRNF